MKVVKLGNTAFAIEPDETADRIERLGVSRLQDRQVSDEAIDIYRRYVGAAVTVALPFDTDGEKTYAVYTIDG